MAGMGGAVAPSGETGQNGAGKSGGVLLPFVILLFFAWGFSTCLVDLVAPALKSLFKLNNFQTALTQTCFFGAYFLMSLPSSWVLSRLGYLRAVVVGLVVMMVGCLLFAPAANTGVYYGFLGALFILASGITLLQVAANPLVALLGKSETASSRLTFAQFLNSFGTYLAPFVGSALILKHIEKAPDAAVLSPAQLEALRHTQAHAVQTPYMIIASGLLVLALLFWVLRKNDKAPQAEAAAGLGEMLALLKYKRLAFAVLCIFVYVGAEVSIGTFMTSYLAQPSTLGLSLSAAGKMLSWYWGGAMVGRLLGSVVLARVSPGKVLTCCALVAVALITTSALTSGVTAGYALLAVGLFNSIMFPTIFTLGIDGMGKKTPAASGLLCMAIVGGAVIPPVTGFTADHIGSLGLAMFVPAVCYLVIAAFGWSAREPAKAIDGLDAAQTVH
ncbi:MULTISPECIES: sugar MFS transporter [Caulobacter]|jgi:FHS family L-fucose permease-like MFS transporter|uniref:Glucose/galactose transporter n=1 Tax=Caulobacter vibrioides OR37 TaxID=1292034 RepID=R0CZR7_CAUVI|nr:MULTISPECIES: sugar MFS transporter [Caulobacter]ENZ81951.1 glucose/galactose transporter [Caulobacter vibrioides OR37]MBQ1562490.1 sugar MFS transporter [Caulobacter sp.]